MKRLRPAGNGPPSDRFWVALTLLLERALDVVTDFAHEAATRALSVRAVFTDAYREAVLCYVYATEKRLIATNEKVSEEEGRHWQKEDNGKTRATT